MLDLAKLQDALEALHRRTAISLTVISNNRSKFKTLTRNWQVPAFYLEWSSSTFSRALRSHQVALIPITRNPFTVCKTNNRLATALLHGLGVAANSIPSYQPFAEACVLDNWTKQLERLVRDTQWRSQLNARGLASLAQHWQLRQIAAQWHEQLSSLCSPSVHKSD
ncbi:hypothetical protein F7Q92_07570 [Ideonella dechloratans]|uniref:Glycosyltransferase family 1 protein n=2 Tax=Ideonella dechloratans TaxID=36863 RepID=A0A643FEA1_IDEDE|nr:hypothetical protein [Ideonella dechloratans]KAB0583528.1 hypothetical protein F7Q92_07570 [Ideonella dechloratans]UFU09059.1 hypothetical protein LRM40_12140 [Ideonella dechloratans]